MGEFTDRRRLEGLTMFVSVEEVRRLLGCSRSRAYEFLREAAGRLPGEHGSLRVSKDVWESFIRRKFHMSHSTIRRIPETPVVADPMASRGGTGKPVAAPKQTGSPDSPEIPLTRPRLKRTATAAPSPEETP